MQNMVKSKSNKLTSSFSLSSLGASFPNRRIMVWRACTSLIPGSRASTTILQYRNGNHHCKIAWKVEVNNHIYSLSDISLDLMFAFLSLNTSCHSLAPPHWGCSPYFPQRRPRWTDSSHQSRSVSPIGAQSK